MFKTSILVSLLLLALSGFACSLDIEEDLLGSPIEYDDKFSSGKYLGYLDNELDIWNEEDKDSKIANKLLQEVCEKYDVTINEKPVDCNNLKLITKSSNKQHNLQKREAEVPLEEGSGEGDDQKPEETDPVEEPKPLEASVNIAPPEEPKDKSSEETDHSEEDKSKEKEKPEEKETPAEKTEQKEKSDQNAEQPPAVTESGTAQEVSATKLEEKANSEEPNAVQESSSIEPVVPPLVHNAAQPTTNETPKISENVDDKSADGKLTPVSAVPYAVPIAPKEEEVLSDKTRTDDKEPSKDAPEIQDGSETKKGRKLGVNLAEEMSPSQSGNAIDESFTNVEEGEKNVPNSKIKAASIAGNENPQTGESSESTGQGRKDAKILIALFVAVLAVGTAAFTYNYVRKKRRSEVRAENGVPQTDPEEGREMKPLMKKAETVETSNEAKS